jgi:hypothetical protein
MIHPHGRAVNSYLSRFSDTVMGHLLQDDRLDDRQGA